jgi:hypothetical protein
VQGTGKHPHKDIQETWPLNERSESEQLAGRTRRIIQRDTARKKW